MANFSEVTFGAKHRNAQKIGTYMVNFPNFLPPDNKLTPTKFNVLVDEIGTTNISIATAEQTYRTAISERVKAFKNEPDSIQMLISPLRDSVIVQYGKKSNQLKQIDSIISKMRGTKITNTATGDSSISRSEQSFGSQLKNFNDLIATLDGFGDFIPTNPILQVAHLTTRAQHISTLNQMADEALQQRKTLRDKRREVLYPDLKDRAMRIKLYVRSTYGKTSSEYLLIKDLAV